MQLPMKQLAYVLAIGVLAVAGCSKPASSAPRPQICDAAAIARLRDNLAKPSSVGLHVALRSCQLTSQGNGEVGFNAAGNPDEETELVCAMKGGEAAVDELRRKERQFDPMKMKLDVSGVIARVGKKPSEQLQMTACTIIVHE
jgi:hypothetical protein